MDDLTSSTGHHDQQGATVRKSKRPQLAGIYMRLTDEGRRRLRTLMVVQNVTQRELAEAAGWASHSYLGRLLRGKVTTLGTDPAIRIARHLGVGVDDLFVSRLSTDTGRSAKRNSAA
jgi:DNA-binding Xre family transcriptional regulator